MAYDEELARRLRTIMGNEVGFAERAAFGGLSFLIHGNMSVGVIGDELVVRVGPDAFEASMAEAHARPFDFTGRPMKGWVYVSAQGLTSEEQLGAWVRRGVEFARSLPPK